MSLRQSTLGEVPPEVLQAVKKIRGKRRNIYIEFADKLGELVDVADFSEVYSRLGQSAVSPLILLLLTIVQFNEGLSDREVMDVLPLRIDWIYLTRLPMDHEGFDPSVLTEFRARLIEGNLEELLLNKILSFAQENGYLKTRSQRTDSTEVLAAARRLARVELILETMVHTLDVLTPVCPKLLVGIYKTFEQLQAYQQSSFQSRIPKSDEARRQLAESIGRDGMCLLAAIDRSDQSSFLNAIPAVETMRLVWTQQFDDTDDKRRGPRFKKKEDLEKSSNLVGSPHDTEARLTTKRGKASFGYKVHVTETCSPGGPNLVMSVLTTPATTSDSSAFEVIERTLRAKGFRPIEHIVDAGYTKAVNMLRSLEQHGTDVVGPLRGGNQWQPIPTGSPNFKIDWDRQKVTCPQGKESRSWSNAQAKDFISVKFGFEDCSACPIKPQCTKGKARHLELKTRDVSEFMAKTREYQKSTEFKKRYSRRSGVEGTISQHQKKGGNRSRFMGLRKTHMQNVLIAGVINVVRLLNHMAGETLAKTRVRKFAQLSIA
jgi:transposase